MTQIKFNFVFKSWILVACCACYRVGWAREGRQTSHQTTAEPNDI